MRRVPEMVMPSKTSTILTQDRLSTFSEVVPTQYGELTSGLSKSTIVIRDEDMLKDQLLDLAKLTGLADTEAREIKRNLSDWLEMRLRESGKTLTNDAREVFVNLLLYVAKEMVGSSFNTNQYDQSIR